MIRCLFRLLLVLWAGSLWSLAAWVAPTVFHTQADRQLAGMLASRLFSIETYVGLAAAAFAVLLPVRGKFKWGFVAAGLLAVNEWALKPVMAMARTDGAALRLSFGAWHGVAGVIYLGACVALAVVVLKCEFLPHHARK
jgi:Domain of unknown function (DUF4149)